MFLFLDYSYPVLTLILFLITNAIHLTVAFKNETRYQSLNHFVSILTWCELLKLLKNRLFFLSLKGDIYYKSIKIYKEPRNIFITLIHIFFYAYAIISLTRLEELLFSLLILILIPFPILFFIISYKFTNPSDHKNY